MNNANFVVVFSVAMLDFSLVIFVSVATVMENTTWHPIQNATTHAQEMEIKHVVVFGGILFISLVRQVFHLLE